MPDFTVFLPRVVLMDQMEDMKLIFHKEMTNMRKSFW